VLLKSKLAVINVKNVGRDGDVLNCVSIQLKVGHASIPTE